VDTLFVLTFPSIHPSLRKSFAVNLKKLAAAAITSAIQLTPHARRIVDWCAKSRWWMRRLIGAMKLTV
jgi:hypothetical protein